MSDASGRGGGLVLVGYRGTGKSTVGRLLAERSGRPFVDADDEIEARAGRSTRAIFEESGEPVFRDWEERVIRDLAEEGRTMVLVTHEMGFARDVASHIQFLHKGKVEEEGLPADIFGNPQSPRLRQFLGSVRE